MSTVLYAPCDSVGGWALALAAAVDDDGLDLDDDELDDLLGPVPVVAKAKFDPKLHLRVPRGGEHGGEFRDMYTRVMEALRKWAAAGGRGDPLPGFEREPLRRFAVSRGVRLPRNADRDVISGALLEDLRGELEGGPRKVPAKKAPAEAAAKKSAPSLNDKFREAIKKLPPSPYGEGGKPGQPFNPDAPPKKAPAKAAPAAPATRKSDTPPDPEAFDRRVTTAATGADALTSAPTLVTFDADADEWTAAGVPERDRARVGKAVATWWDRGQDVNEYLRDGSDAYRPGRGKLTAAANRRTIADLDRLYEVSRLQRDTVVWRGFGGRSLFGADPDAWPDDLAGTEWVDRGYVSSAAERSEASNFTVGGSAGPMDRRGVLARILLPGGAPVLSLSEMEATELLLSRGWTFRVVRDHGWVEEPRRAGVRRHRLLDVEATPPRATVRAPAKKSAPAKAVPPPDLDFSPEGDRRRAQAHIDRPDHAGGSAQRRSGWKTGDRLTVTYPRSGNTVEVIYGGPDPWEEGSGWEDRGGAHDVTRLDGSDTQVSGDMLSGYVPPGAKPRKATPAAKKAVPATPAKATPPAASSARAHLLTLSTNDERREYLVGLGLNQTQARRLAKDLSVKGAGRLDTDGTIGQIVKHFDTEGPTQPSMPKMAEVKLYREMGGRMPTLTPLSVDHDASTGVMSERPLRGKWNPSKTGRTGHVAFDAPDGVYQSEDRYGTKYVIVEGGVARQVSLDEARQHLTGGPGKGDAAAPAAPRAPTQPFSLAAYQARQGEIRRIIRSGMDHQTVPLAGGNIAGTSLLTYADGSKLVDKGRLGIDSRRSADAEELGGLVAHVVGVRAPVVVRSANHVTMEFIEGRPGGDLTADEIARLADSPEGRRMGLMDAIIGTSDRARNWIAVDRGRVAAIDFGVAFGRRAEFRFGSENPFTRYLVQPGPGGTLRLRETIDVPASDVRAIRARLQTLEPEFTRLGRADWHAAMMENVAELERRASPDAATPQATADSDRGASTRIGAAATGDDVPSQVVINQNSAALTDAERATLGSSVGIGFEDMGAVLRGRKPPHGTSPRKLQQKIAAIDGVMRRSPLRSDVELWRGTESGRTVFGDRLAGDLTGFEWTESAFVSTSYRRSQGELFATQGAEGPGVLLRIVAPRGVGAVELYGGEGEILLQRGLRMRVTRDHGISDVPVRDYFGRVIADARPVRILDVEVARDDPFPRPIPTTAADPDRDVLPRIGAGKLTAADVDHDTLRRLEAAHLVDLRLREPYGAPGRDATDADLATNPGAVAVRLTGRGQTKLEHPDATPDQVAEITAARARQRLERFDRLRGVAETLTMVDELRENGASARAVEHRLRTAADRHHLSPDMVDELTAAATSADRTRLDATIDRIATEHGLTRISAPAGGVEPFDRRKHQPLVEGSGLRDGQPVHILRAGYMAADEGDEVQLHRAVVDEATRPLRGDAAPQFDLKRAMTEQGVSESEIAGIRERIRVERPRIFIGKESEEGFSRPGGGDAELARFYSEHRDIYNYLVQEERIPREWVDQWGTVQVEDQQRNATRAVRRAVAPGTPIVIRRATEANLRRALSDGRLKTQHETGTSSGFVDTDLRRDFEGMAFGLPHDLPVAERPVYGYVAVGGLDVDTGERLAQYGEIRIVLREAVRPRVTVGVGDSLDKRSEMRPMPIGEADWHAVRPVIADYSGFGGYDSSQFRDAHYVEAQIHGGVRTEDIEEVVFTVQPEPETVQALERAGVSWRILKSRTTAKATPAKKAPAKAVAPRSRTAPSVTSFFDSDPSGPDEERLTQAFTDALEGDYGTGGLRFTHVGAQRMAPTVFQSNGKVERRSSGTVLFGGQVVNADGAVVGRVTGEVFYDDEAGKWVGHISDFYLDDEVQGTGFARDFNTNLFAWYRRSGVDQVELSSGESNGPYVWASQGFDFADDEQLTGFLDRTQDSAREALRRRAPDLDEAEVTAQENLWKSLVREARSGKRHVSAKEFSQAGRQPGQGKDDWWVGKAVMSHWTAGFDGVLPLKPAKKATPRKTAAKVAAGPRETAPKAPGRAGKDLLRTAPGRKTLADGAIQARDANPDRPHGDEMLYAIADRQGFTAHPRQVDRATFDTMVASGQPELWRGMETQAHADQLVAGDYRAADNLGYGSGISLSEHRMIARMYGDDLVRVTFAPDARIVDLGEVLDGRDRRLAGLAPDDPQRLVFADPGRYAAARGIDVIRIRGDEHAGGVDTDDPDFLAAIAGEYGITADQLTPADIAALRDPRNDHYIVLNRSALVVDVESSSLGPAAARVDTPTTSVRATTTG